MRTIRHHLIPQLLTLAMLAPAGCSNEDGIADTGGGNADTGNGTEAGPGDATDEGTDDAATDDADDADDDTSGGGPSIDEALDCEEDLVVDFPLSGPGVDPQTGEFIGKQDSYVVSTTQLVLKPDADSQMLFGEFVNEIVPQVMAADGLVGVSFASESGCRFRRTLSIWESTKAMYTFAASGAHLKAMQQTSEIGLTGRVTNWNHPTQDGAPTWEQAIATLDEVAPFPATD